MSELKIYAPTYYGNNRAEDATGPAKSEFDDPYCPVLVRSCEGVRVVLGSHDYFDVKAPDIQVERRPNGWMIFLHPLGGGDPSGTVFFLDDGRSYFVAEHGLGITPPIAEAEWEDAVSKVDAPLKKDGR